ncbi:Glycosyltransferase, GT2 family [Quadrisphaera granulorum]|uniref:GT2 family glycosyltransferase n=1 Tax=Quadrisphaera granulorum TaxID=317664 RepID=A0A315ZJL0_9ACTN|nr:glycosyltransferase family A protein [Quadrisphaera granulorum]PWJ45805.1 GT2 family glycosyltransferase [Quadrisphaera granulorum]SZE99110.1 Glycosyltransferase, GT2 family [Quadrisphaera granulorum]
MTVETRADTAVLVATYRRPDKLAKLMESLAQCRAFIDFDIIVADNDPGSTTPLAARTNWPTGLSIKVVLEPRPGIAAARNRLLDEAKEYPRLVFVDDDETVDPDWLQRLIEAQKVSGAGMITGPIFYTYPAETPPWAILGNFMMADMRDESRMVSAASTNNLLIQSQALYDPITLRFDEKFGLTGGSDIMLTRRFTQAGGLIFFEKTARVHEEIPPERANARWFIKRAFRAGNTDARVQLALDNRIAAHVRVFGLGFLRLWAGVALLVTHPYINQSATGAKALRMIIRGTGYLYAAAGQAYSEYNRK